MIATYVAPQKTEGVFEQLWQAFNWALTEETRFPRPEVVSLAMAKSALETARWTSMFNWNFGNVKAGSSYAGQYTCIVLNERLVRNGIEDTVWFRPDGELSAAPSKGGKLVHAPLAVPPGHPQTRMRGFANRWDGADAYARALRSIFKKSYDALWTGDPKAFVYALKAERYFTADPEPYARAVTSLQKEFTKRARDIGPGADPTIHMREKDEWEGIAVECIDTAVTPMALCMVRDAAEVREANATWANS